ncbi:MAG: HAMP domain-containing sensor histidine kinase [Acidobacteriota bacterium]
MKPETPTADYLFAAELFGRLVWFVRLRWMAVAGLVAASLIGPSLGLPGVWPALLVVGSVVAAFNIFFTNHLGWRSRREQPYEHLRSCAVRQILSDLAALVVTAHYTGGLQSPALLFFAFHMAIGTIILPTRIMYVVAACTSGAMFTVYMLELNGVLAFHPLDPNRGMCGAACHFNMGAFIFALVGVVALTDSVTSRFKKRNLKLWETTQELRQSTGELQRSLEQVETVEQRKSHYMRISAHQLRSPLATVRTSLQVLTEGFVEPGTDRGRRLLDGALERVDDLLVTVNGLLDLAKMREGRASAPWTRKVNVNQLLTDIFDALEPLAQAREIRLVPEFEGVVILDWGVPPDLIFAFENLIENAIKYSREGGEVVARLRVQGDRATVEVRDQGIGIPEKFLDDVLHEFVRAPNGKRHAPQGTGLGLAIAREAVEAHGGALELWSREGEGTTATVSLPLHLKPMKASS